jgi:hypothetical protein
MMGGIRPPHLAVGVFASSLLVPRACEVMFLFCCCIECMHAEAAVTAVLLFFFVFSFLPLVACCFVLYCCCHYSKQLLYTYCTFMHTPHSQTYDHATVPVH